MVGRRSRLLALRGSAVAALAALSLAILPAAPALAAPAAPPAQSAADKQAVAQAKQLQARLDKQYADLERLSEQLVKAEEVERQLREEQAGLQLLRRSAEQELASSQQRLELLRGADSKDLEATTQSVRQVRRRKADLDRVRGRVAMHLVRQQHRHSDFEAERKRLDLLNKRLEATLRGLEPRLRGALEAAQAQTEAQRRAAYDLWAASVGGQGQAAWLQSGNAARIAVAYALHQLGKPYQWGAEGPGSFDCSGLTSASYLAAGVAIPRVAADQFYAGIHIGVADLLAGDLIFYADNPANPATIHHVGMYIGKGLMVHSPHTGDVVRIASIWRNGYAGAVRVVPGMNRPGVLPPTTAPVPVPNPPVGTLPPPGTAPPTTTRPPGTGTTKPTAPPTTAPRTSGTSTTSTGTTTTTAPPTTAAPTTAAPTTAAPTTAAPTTAAPTTAATTTEPPTTAPPTTAASTTTDQATTTTTTAPPTTTAAAAEEPTTTTTSGG
jgi:cell wall-associated NlpC family hydrolase